MYDVKNIGPNIRVNSKKLINLCSKDYLGIKSPKISKKQNQSSSRLIAGNDELFKILESKLAKHKSQDNALIFPTGYMANLGVITSLIQKNDHVYSDEFNHASLIEACKMTGAKITIFKHNDMSDLKIISEISQKHDAITILDDAHGDFIIGKDGGGSANYFGVEKKIDIYTSSLSKGLGSFGGYIASQKNVIELSINKSKSFIYTSALPSLFIDDAIKRFDSDREKRRKQLWENTNYFSTSLKKIGYENKSKSHIIPIMIGKEKLAIEFAIYLRKNGIFVHPIRYPTVPKNQARIRISITALLTKKQIKFSLDVFDKARKKFQIG